MDDKLLAQIRKKELTQHLIRVIQFHRDKHEAVKGLDPATQLREEGALSALETTMIQLFQKGLVYDSNLPPEEWEG